MLKYSLTLFITLLCIGASYCMTFISENIRGESYNRIFIPYADFFPTYEGNSKLVDNEIKVLIFDSDEQINFQMRYLVSLKIDLDRDSGFFDLNRELYPIAFNAELEKGKQELFVTVAHTGSGSKREYREVFFASKREKDIGFFFLEAEENGLKFLVRDKNYLYNRFDSLKLLQSMAVRPDSTMLVLTMEKQEVRLKPTELVSLPDYLNGVSYFDLEVQNYLEGVTYKSELIYPNPAYFFQQNFSPEEQLAQLRYIINQNQYRTLRGLSGRELQDAINDFWREVDSDPYDLENSYQATFYRRIRYADNTFQVRRYLPGWRTDMGRVYIMYGDPDETVSDVFPIGRDPSITWYYYSLNKVFRFYDMRGYGNYELKDKWRD